MRRALPQETQHPPGRLKRIGAASILLFSLLAILAPSSPAHADHREYPPLDNVNDVEVVVGADNGVRTDFEVTVRSRHDGRLVATSRRHHTTQSSYTFAVDDVPGTVEAVSFELLNDNDPAAGGKDVNLIIRAVEVDNVAAFPSSHFDSGSVRATCSGRSRPSCPRPHSDGRAVVLAWNGTHYDFTGLANVPQHHVVVRTDGQNSLRSFGETRRPWRTWEGRMLAIDEIHTGWSLWVYDHMSDDGRSYHVRTCYDAQSLSDYGHLPHLGFAPEWISVEPHECRPNFWTVRELKAYGPGDPGYRYPEDPVWFTHFHKSKPGYDPNDYWDKWPWWRKVQAVAMNMALGAFVPGEVVEGAFEAEVIADEVFLEDAVEAAGSEAGPAADNALPQEMAEAPADRAQRITDRLPTAKQAYGNMPVRLERVPRGDGSYRLSADGSSIWVSSESKIPLGAKPTGNVGTVRNDLYHEFEMGDTFYKDCCHTAEEIMAQQQLDGTVFHSKVANSNIETANDAATLRNIRNFARENGDQANVNARPEIGQAFLTVPKKATLGYHYHAAAVVAEDETHVITAEIFADESAEAKRIYEPTFKRYRKEPDRIDPSFHQFWDKKWGGGSATVVIEPLGGVNLP